MTGSGRIVLVGVWGGFFRELQFYYYCKPDGVSFEEVRSGHRGCLDGRIVANLLFMDAGIAIMKICEWVGRKRRGEMISLDTDIEYFGIIF